MNRMIDKEANETEIRNRMRLIDSVLALNYIYLHYFRDTKDSVAQSREFPSFL